MGRKVEPGTNNFAHAKYKIRPETGPDAPKALSIEMEELAAETLEGVQIDNSVPPNSSSMGSNLSEKQRWTDKVFSWRYFMVLLLHTSFGIAIYVRTCMPMALVCMTSTRTKTSGENVSDVLMSANDSGGRFDNPSLEFEFDWDPEKQGLILSAVFFLPCIAPFVTNALQPLLGQKWTLTSLNLFSVVVNCLTPLAARISPWALIASRILMGTTFGNNVPVIGDFVAWWAPSNEKQTMISIVFIGLQTGSVLTGLLSGYLCIIPIDHGWPFIFYFIGILDLVWVLAWHFLSSSRPEHHKFISEKELNYILKHRDIKGAAKKKKAARIPFKTILTSVPVLVFLFTGGLIFWTLTLYFTYLIIYLAAVLNFNPTETGLLMSLYGVVRILGMGFWTALHNRMQKTKKFSTTTVKKTWICIGTTLCALCHIVILFLDESHRWTVVAVFAVLLFGQTVGICLFPAIPQDLAPRYAGFITGMYFAIGSLISISSPLIVSSLTPNNTAEEWKSVWYVTICIFATIVIVFLFFGDSSLQPWAKDSPDTVQNIAVISGGTSSTLEISHNTHGGNDVRGKFSSLRNRKNENFSGTTPTSNTTAVGNSNQDENPMQEASESGNNSVSPSISDVCDYMNDSLESDTEMAGVVNAGFVSGETNTDTHLENSPRKYIPNDCGSIRCNEDDLAEDGDVLSCDIITFVTRL